MIPAPVIPACFASLISLSCWLNSKWTDIDQGFPSNGVIESRCQKSALYPWKWNCRVFLHIHQRSVSAHWQGLGLIIFWGEGGLCMFHAVSQCCAEPCGVTIQSPMSRKARNCRSTGDKLKFWSDRLLESQSIIPAFFAMRRWAGHKDPIMWRWDKRVSLGSGCLTSFFCFCLNFATASGGHIKTGAKQQLFTVFFRDVYKQLLFWKIVCVSVYKLFRSSWTPQM